MAPYWYQPLSESVSSDVSAAAADIASAIEALYVVSSHSEYEAEPKNLTICDGLIMAGAA
jgi:hypothetical protein